MTPGARLAAAIEIIDAIEATQHFHATPADRLIAGYMRQRRFIGSGDRRYLRNFVYRLLRHRARLIWWAEQAGLTAPGKTPGRGLVLATLRLLDGCGVEDVVAQWGGGKYAPAALDENERKALAVLPGDIEAGAQPQNVRLEFPSQLAPMLAARFGEAVEAELTAFLDRPPLALRVNRLLATPEGVIESLATGGIAARAAPWGEGALLIDGHPPVKATECWRAGHIEVQDSGAQLAAGLVAAGPSMQVVDLCAGGGGKTLALAATMANSGQIYAFDAEPARLGDLAKRLQRAAVRNVTIVGAPDEGGLAALPAAIDRLVLDVPCSGSGTWRRNPETRWRITNDDLDRLAALQASLLDRGAGLVAPGGRLVYITCSVLPRENEEAVTAFLAREKNFRLLDYRKVATGAGIAVPGDSAALIPECLQLSPLRHAADGFFIAIMERLDSPRPHG